MVDMLGSCVTPAYTSFGFEELPLQRHQPGFNAHYKVGPSQNRLHDQELNRHLSQAHSLHQSQGYASCKRYERDVLLWLSECISAVLGG